MHARLIQRVAGYALAGLLLTACESERPAESTWFAETSGVDFTWRSGHGAPPGEDEITFRIPEIMGGGGTFIDFDGDGLLDIYLVQGGAEALQTPMGGRGQNRLFRNLGEFRWRDVTAETGAGAHGYGMGATSGDYDGDGDEDIYVTNLHGNVLLRNDGGRFTDVTLEAGAGEHRWSTAAAFFDMDGDGDLDLFVVNYLDRGTGTEPRCFGRGGAPEYCGPGTYASPLPDTLYRNNGDGTFTDISMEAGIAGITGNGLGLAIDDFNGDGKPDIFVANDTNPDHLWIASADGYVERGAELGVARDLHGKAKAGMGVGVGDIDGNLRPDLLVVNLFQETDSLFLNHPDFFNDVTPGAGLAPSRSLTRFGAGFADFDNDGRPDVFEASGKIDRQHGQVFEPGSYAEPNLLYRGTEGRFEKIDRAGLAIEAIATSRGALFGDLDNDGGIDLLIINRDSPSSLLRNVYPDRGNWLTLDIRNRSGSAAIGAIVTLETGQTKRRGAVRPVYSYLSGNDPRVHFGLGASQVAPRVTVQWPDGARREFGPLPANRIHRLEPSATQP